MSYYQAVWLAICLLTLAGVFSFYFSKPGTKSLHEPYWYWGLSIPLLCFTLLRPFGIAADDASYVNIFNRLCPIAECGQWVQSERDFIWYTLVAGLKFYWPDFRLVLVLSTVTLLVKLVIIRQLSRQPLLGLLAYMAIFYPIYDYTAFRVSMTVAVYMIGFLLLVRCCVMAGLPYLMVNGLIHKQAFTSPGVLIGPVFGWRWWVFPMIIILFVGLIALGCYPSPDASHPGSVKLGAIGLDISAYRQDIQTYLGEKQRGWYDKVRLIPLSIVPLLLLVIWISRDLFIDDHRLFKYAAGSVALAVVCLWAMAWLPDVQMRLVHFSLTPLIFILGNTRPSPLKVWGVLIVCFGYVFRYVYLHPITEVYSGSMDAQIPFLYNLLHR